RFDVYHTHRSTLFVHSTAAGTPYDGGAVAHGRNYVLCPLDREWLIARRLSGRVATDSGARPAHRQREASSSEMRGLASRCINARTCRISHLMREASRLHLLLGASPIA